jgi:tripartite ATP-independent transporter DctP family solute receptor
MKKTCVLVLTCVVALSLFAACSGSSGSGAASSAPAVAPAQEPLLIRCAGLITALHSFKGIQLWAKDVMEKTGGSIKVELYPDYQLGADREICEAIQMENFEMDLPAVSVLTNFVPEFTIISLPYIFPDDETANTVMEGPFGEEMLKTLEPAGFKGLVFTTFGVRHVTNNVRPITKVEDFKGLKLRTMENAAHLELFRTLGANPTAMAATEIFTALQQGVVDGQENAIPNIFSQGYYEVQKYLSLTGHVYEWVPYVLGLHVWKKMSADQQKIVMDVSVSVRKFLRDLEIPQTHQDSAKIEQAGCKINAVTPAEKERIIKAVQPVVDKFGGIHPELFKRLRDEVAKAGK